MYSNLVTVSKYRHETHDSDGQGSNELYIPSDSRHLFRDSRMYDITLHFNDLKIFEGRAMYLDKSLMPANSTWNDKTRYSEVHLTVHGLHQGNLFEDK